MKQHTCTLSMASTINIPCMRMEYCQAHITLTTSAVHPIVKTKLLKFSDISDWKALSKEIEHWYPSFVVSWWMVPMQLSLYWGHSQSWLHLKMWLILYALRTIQPWIQLTSVIHYWLEIINRIIDSLFVIVNQRA